MLTPHDPVDWERRHCLRMLAGVAGLPFASLGGQSAHARFQGHSPISKKFRDFRSGRFGSARLPDGQS
jgi:hypothetical protein